MVGKPLHGDSYPCTRLYNVWRNMNRRCDNPNAPQYKDWGGRGISVCEEWKKNYPCFRRWALANGYTDELVIDRKDNDGPYCPDNCHFTTRKRNSRNRRNNRLETAFGETKTLKDWIDDPRCRAAYYTVMSRIDGGWPVERAIESPTKC